MISDSESMSEASVEQLMDSVLATEPNNIIDIAPDTELTQGARRTDVEANIGLVHFVARKHVNCGIPYDDVFQEGAVGLVVAVSKFDPARNVKLSAYATRIIEGSILHAIRDKGPAMRGKRESSVSRDVRDIKIATEVLYASGQATTNENIARLSGLDESVVKESRPQLPLAPRVESLDALEDYQIGISKRPSKMYPTTEDVDNRMLVDQLLSKLDEKKRTVVRYIYGLPPYSDTHTKAETGQLLHVSQAEVGRILARAFTELRPLELDQ